jgi:hypothetical protein
LNLINIENYQELREILKLYHHDKNDHLKYIIVNDTIKSKLIKDINVNKDHAFHDYFDSMIKNIRVDEYELAFQEKLGRLKIFKISNHEDYCIPFINENIREFIDDNYISFHKKLNLTIDLSKIDNQLFIIVIKSMQFPNYETLSIQNVEKLDPLNYGDLK